MPLDEGRRREGDKSSGQSGTSGSKTTVEWFRRRAEQEQERRQIYQQQTFANMGEKWVQSRRGRVPKDLKREVALPSIGTNKIDLAGHIKRISRTHR